MRVFLFAIALLGAFATAAAQKTGVTGKVVEKATGDVLPGATAVLLSVGDSVRVSGAAAAADGTFAIPGVGAGSYILNAAYLKRLLCYPFIYNVKSLGNSQRNFRFRWLMVKRNADHLPVYLLFEPV